MLGAALGFVAPWNAVPVVFIALVQTIAGLCAFALARRFATPGAALFGAACYAANPYALLIVYMRSDFAELLACALMPVLLLAALQICGLVKTHRSSQPRATVYFALVFAAVWLSNAPAGVMASYSVALIFVWAAFVEKSSRPLWHGVAGAALGFALASFYLFPAAYEQRWVNITQALSPGLLPSDNFLYTMTNDPEHNLFNWIASSVAILLVVVTGMACIAARQRKGNEENRGEREGLWRVLLFLSAVATALMIRPSLVFWEHLFKLRFVQFPWRWMSILAVPYAFFLAMAVTRRRLGWIWIVVALMVSAGTATFLVQNAWWDSEDIPVLQEAIANDQGFEGTDEYDPIGDDRSNLPEKTPAVQILPADGSEGSAPKSRIDIQQWTAEEKDVAVNSDEPMQVAVRLLNYPAWRVDVNGKAVTPQRVEAIDQVVVPVPAGLSHIRIRFVRTPDRTLGIAVSVIGVLALLALFNAGGLRILSASP